MFRMILLNREARNSVPALNKELAFCVNLLTDLDEKRIE